MTPLPNPEPTSIQDEHFPPVSTIVPHIARETKLSILDHWRHYMSGIKSPNSFIDAGFYFMIGAALQRRVWTPYGPDRTYANLYTTLCGPPGVGKGLVIKPVKHCLTYYAFDEMANPKKLDPYMLQAIEMGSSEEDATEAKDVGVDKPLLFPLSGNTITFEKLVNSLAEAIRAIKYAKEDPKTGEKKAAIYLHSSLNIILTEMASLFRRNSEGIVSLLTDVFDCGDYKYETKNNGTDRVRKPCVNILAGTTPVFIQSASNSNMFDDGFFGRILMVYEGENRFHRFGAPKTTREQAESLCEVIKHLRKLAQMYGEVRLTPDADAFMREYFETVLPFKKVNNSPHVHHYYSRKEAMAMKLAMSIHFSSDLSNVINLSDCQASLAFLEQVERKMHMPFASRGSNPLSGVAIMVVKMLDKQALTFIDIWKELNHMANKEQLSATMEFLISTGQVTHFEASSTPGAPVQTWFKANVGPKGAVLTAAKQHLLKG